VTFATNIFQFEKPVSIGNDVLKESITKPGTNLQGIITTLNKPNQVACVESEISGICARYIVSANFAPY